MKKTILIAIIFCALATSLFGQDEKEKSEKGFKKENLFTGGSISLAFYNYTFLIGANPVFGYSLARWVDVGIVGNYNYTSYRYASGYLDYNDKLRQTVFGGGAFLKLYPIRFLFVQAQPEHNFISLKYLPPGLPSSTRKTDVNSLLVGGGYTTGRFPGDGRPFFYLAVLFDVSGNDNSPYTDVNGNAIPIIRAGFQVPLFQGSQGRFDQSENGRRRPRSYNR